MVFVYVVASAFKVNHVNIMFGNSWKHNSTLWVPTIPAIKTQITEKQLYATFNVERRAPLYTSLWVLDTDYWKAALRYFQCGAKSSAIHFLVGLSNSCVKNTGYWKQLYATFSVERRAPLFTFKCTAEICTTVLTVVHDFGRTGSDSKLNTLYRVRSSKEN
jgi:hypothetical protein